MSSLIHRLLVVLLACLWVPIAVAKTFILYAGSYTAGSSKGIYAWKFDSANGALSPLGLMAETAQPAHLWISPSGRFLYAVDWEKEGAVSAFRIQRISTLPPGTTTPNTTAEILIDATGRHLYVSNRGHDSISVFAIAPASGKLTLEANVPSGGRTPRNIRLDPTGLLTPTHVVAQIDTPGGLYFRPMASVGQTLWHFDNLERIGGFKVDVEGQPRVIHSPVGGAIQFDGHSDSLLIDGRPLVGASTFTIEVVFRPDGGAFEQRFMHIAETDPRTGLDAPAAGTEDLNERIMFEVRVVGGDWYLDAFVKSQAGSKTLASSKSLHPLGKWYAVAQTYDGKTYRAYVDGKLESEAEVLFVPHGPGRMRVGARMNRVSYFHGAIAEARFNDRVLTPEQFLKARN